MPVTLHRYLGMVHGFFQLGGVITAGRAAIAEAGAFLRSPAVILEPRKDQVL